MALESPAEVRARPIDSRGRLEMFLGDELAPLRHHEEAWRFAAVDGPHWLHARVAEGLGEVLHKVGETGRATILLEQAAAIGRETRHPGTPAEARTLSPRPG